MFDDLSAYYHEDVVSAFVDYRDTSKDGVAEDAAATSAAH